MAVPAACALSLSLMALTPTAAADPTVTLPPMTSSGSGPMLGGGDATQTSAAQQLTDLHDPNVQQVDGSDAAQFITAAAATPNPQLAAAFTLLHRALVCQSDAGSGAGFAARAYRRTDGQWGGAMLVTARATVPNVESLANCAKTNWHKPKAGGETSMCNNGWAYPTGANSRRGEGYFVLLAGTAADFCSTLNASYRNSASSWP